MKKNIPGCSKGNDAFDIDQLLNSYSNYLQDARGLAPRTINEYCKAIKFFLHAQSQGNEVHLQRIYPRDIVQFILKDSRNKGKSHAQQLTYPLRSFFRFLTQTQQLKEELANFVPSIANRKKTSYPQVLSHDETTKLLQSCNR
jgi:site-specific recombinase XerD